MGIVIALAGKGGTGKTTLAAIIIGLLARKGTVLGVDGDPNTNLPAALGVEVEETVGDVREEMLNRIRKGSFDASVPKQDYLEVRINQALVETPGFDVIAMGRPEGKGCYCAANNMLRLCLERLVNSYDYVVIDNEAGMEHLSRQRSGDIDLLLLVSDPSLRGLTAARRIKELVGELGIRVGRVALIINRVRRRLSPEMMEQANSLELIAILEEEEEIARRDEEGTPLIPLPLDSPLQAAIEDILLRLGLTKAKVSAGEGTGGSGQERSR
ncbi:MAG: AAA family ATPase [Chloroflexi bacterium]|nr:AAA family ATPase [Chloroflexota bacterium]